MRNGLRAMIMVGTAEHGRAPWRSASAFPPGESWAGIQKPRVLLEKSDCPEHRFTDGQLRLPSQFPEARRIEKDERTITDPAAIAAGIRKLRMHAECFRDPGDGIAHAAGVVGTHVENVHAGGRPLDGQDDGRYAILHMDV